jgi:hypothetical protein
MEIVVVVVVDLTTTFSSLLSSQSSSCFSGLFLSTSLPLLNYPPYPHTIKPSTYPTTLKFP